MNRKDEQAAIHPTIFVIFGITGDLAARKLLPALLALYSKKLLPPRFSIIGCSRKHIARDEFREYIRNKMNVRPGRFKEEDVKHFLDHISYEQGYFEQEDIYKRLAEHIKSIDDRFGQCTNKLFHLSVPPALYECILKQISSSGLSKPCADDTGWTRVLRENPFGSDVQSAKSLDLLLGRLFKEQQIFRIDHYLAKESVQNILAFRFSNAMFEPLWRGEYIDKVHIKLFEKNTMEGRGSFYDTLGALRDVGQNHMLMMLALMAMEKPDSFSAHDIRRERGRVLRKLEVIPKRALNERVVRRQYVGYISEPGVKPSSQTETYVRLEVHLGMARWKKVPFFLETGKAMVDSKTEIDIYFKDSKKGSFSGGAKHKKDQAGNVMTFRIQPDEGIKIRFFVKTPGYDFKTEPKTLKFKYADNGSFGAIPDDYERLIHDVFLGDQTLFASTEEIMASWKFITPILANWGRLPLKKYPKGSKDVE